MPTAHGHIGTVPPTCCLTMVIFSMRPPGSLFSQHPAPTMSPCRQPCPPFGGLQDGPHRWSMGPLYNMGSLQFQSHFFVQEQSVAVDLDGPIDLAALPCDKPRPR